MTKFDVTVEQTVTVDAPDQDAAIDQALAWLNRPDRKIVWGLCNVIDIRGPDDPPESRITIQVSGSPVPEDDEEDVIDIVNQTLNNALNEYGCFVDSVDFGEAD